MNNGMVLKEQSLFKKLLYFIQKNTRQYINEHY